MGKRRSYLESEAVQHKAVEVLKRGGVAVLPTDTLYGLSAALSSAEGYNRILRIKECTGLKNFLMLASSIAMVERFICSWGCAKRELLNDIWPAPLTAIFPSGPICPPWSGESIALRVPDYEPVRNVIEKLGEPIVSTSVNVGGNPPLHDIAVIERTFGSRIDFIAASKKTAQDLPSTIVDFTRSSPHVVREGSYPW
jgi:L-threonylcarbamoyladenylate synthase